MSELVEDLDAGIEERSLLKHAFYRMWSEGKLSREHLAGYSMEYFQLVRAVPELVKSIDRFVQEPKAKKVVSEILREETEHIELWAKFAASMGVSRDALMAYQGTAKTRRAIAKLKEVSEESFCKAAAAMYSIESEQPRISRTKLDGLVAFYGMTARDDGTEYFREHEVADLRHAAVWRRMLQKLVAPHEEGLSLEASALSLGVQNSILDSVMETYVSPASA
jgi:pyrroloquinoline-quinone synthase